MLYKWIWQDLLQLIVLELVELWHRWQNYHFTLRTKRDYLNFAQRLDLSPAVWNFCATHHVQITPECSGNLITRITCWIRLKIIFSHQLRWKFKFGDLRSSRFWRMKLARFSLVDLWEYEYDYKYAYLKLWVLKSQRELSYFSVHSLSPNVLDHSRDIIPLNLPRLLSTYLLLFSLFSRRFTPA